MLDKSKSLNDAVLEDVVGGNGDQTIKCDCCGEFFSTVALTSVGTKRYCTKCYSKLSKNPNNETGDDEEIAKSGNTPPGTGRFVTSVKNLNPNNYI